MKQAYVPTVGTITYRDVERPVAGPGQVLIRVARVGICGSDVHVFKGEHPIVQPPLIQGHEVSGHVVELGEGVADLDVGDLVVVEPAIGCGTCPKCRAGLIAQCPRLQFIGGNLPGGGAEFLAVSAAQLVRLSPGTSPDDAALTEPLACAVHALGRAPDVRGRAVFVTGAGPIGNLTGQVARLRGARSVVISDLVGPRRDVAERCGLRAVDPTTERGIAADGHTIEAEEVDIAFECVGAEPALDDCIGSVQRGGSVVVLGVYPNQPRTNMIAVQDRELSLVGSLMYTMAEFREAASLIGHSQLVLRPLQTHHFPLEAWLEGYRVLEDRDAGAVKVLIDVA